VLDLSCSPIFWFLTRRTCVERRRWLLFFFVGARQCSDQPAPAKNALLIVHEVETVTSRETTRFHAEISNATNGSSYNSTDRQACS